MIDFRLKLVPDYSRLDGIAAWLIAKEPEKFATLRRAQKSLEQIRRKIMPRMGKGDYMPRIDIITSDGKVFKWGFR